MRLADSICKLIAIVILGIVLLFSYGCGVDSLKCYEIAKKKAGTDLIIRTRSGHDNQTFLIIDNKGRVRELTFNGLLSDFTPNLRSDIVRFENIDIEKAKLRQLKTKTKEVRK